ncbi:hypothetical protein MUNTM_45770 [Mycobacterium sp. MUNTM1]
MVNLWLWRYDDEDSNIKPTYEKDPLPGVEAERLRHKVLDAAAAVGMTITADSGLKPPKPPRSEG